MRVPQGQFKLFLQVVVQSWYLVLHGSGADCCSAEHGQWVSEMNVNVKEVKEGVGRVKSNKIFLVLQCTWMWWENTAASQWGFMKNGAILLVTQLSWQTVLSHAISAGTNWLAFSFWFCAFPFIWGTLLNSELWPTENIFAVHDLPVETFDLLQESPNTASFHLQYVSASANKWESLKMEKSVLFLWCKKFKRDFCHEKSQKSTGAKFQNKKLSPQ